MPAPDLREMMRLLVNSKKDVKIDVKSTFKSVWVTNALDRSEDCLVSDKILGLVGESMTSFQTEMTAKPPRKPTKSLLTQ